MHAARVTREVGQDSCGREEEAEVSDFQPSVEGRLLIIIASRQTRSVVSQPIRQICVALLPAWQSSLPHAILRCKRSCDLNGKNPTFIAGFAAAGVGRN